MARFELRRTVNFARWGDTPNKDVKPCLVLSFVLSEVIALVTRFRLKTFQPDTNRHIQIVNAEMINVTKNNTT